jgi:pyrimidine oxygenase
MDLGIFLPIANNGWLRSLNAPHYAPTFELNKSLVQSAERYGFEFALSMVRFKGYGGETGHWDQAMESFTLTAGLAAVTSQIKLFASTAIVTMPPAVVAQMASTINSIAPGRFGVNIVSGWNKPEYGSIGLWPGDEHFQRRYEHATEYVQVMRQLWETGASTFNGKFCKTEEAQLLPPLGHIDVVGAGQSDEGMRFVAAQADFNFIMGRGLNTPLAFAETVARLRTISAEVGRPVGAYVVFMVIAEASADAAARKWNSYVEGCDHAVQQAVAAAALHNTSFSEHSSTKVIIDTQQAVNANMGTLVGSYAEVAAMLDEVASVEGVSGVMLVFDEFREGIEKFGQFVQPLMTARSHLKTAA